MSTEKVSRAIKECMKILNSKKYDLKVQRMSTQGANFTSNLYKVELIPENAFRSLKLFVKEACPSTKMRGTLDEWKIYATEKLFYTRLVEKYKELQNNSHIPINDRITFCNYYAHKSVPNEEMIILEDLTAEKWMAYDRFQPMTWPYAKAAIGELAKFHALSFVYKIKDEEEYKKVIEELKITMNLESLAPYIQNARELALQYVNPERKELLEKYLCDFESKIQKVGEPINCTIITHGVYRPSNLMHKIRPDGEVDIKIVDLQTLQGACPVVDLLYFVFTSTDQDFREEYFQKLIDHYFKQLSDAIGYFNLDPDYVYSRQVFESEFRKKLPYGLTIAVFALPVVTVSVENTPKVDENLELTAFLAGKPSDLYIKRLNGIVEDFVKWGLLK